MDELFGQAGQQSLIDAAAAKAASKLPNSTHDQGSVEAKGSAPPRPKSRPTSRQGTPVRPHAAHGDRGNPDSDNSDSSDDRLLTAAQVKRRYGSASDMWLWRRLHDGSGFPKPIFICRRRFWRLSGVIAWERSRAVGSA
jgi:hypothetical protein